MISICPRVSVIIPTHNRKGMLRETLASLAQQTYPFDSFEVIVVDDGSVDGTGEIAEEHFPYQLRYIRQENQGDATARNRAAMASQAEVLVSLDDDMILERDYLASLVGAFEEGDKTIAAGASYVWLDTINPLLVGTRFQRIPPDSLTNQKLPFPKLCTNSMAMRREDFLAVGAMQDLGFKGSSLWSDVDLAYRAYMGGYQFVRIGKAIIWHRDYVYKDLETHRKRAYLMAYRSVSLFAKYPGLIDHLPMFDDKREIDWAHDRPELLMRKIARRFTSTRFVLRSMEQLYDRRQKMRPDSYLPGALIRWIGGGNVARGYRHGCKDLRQGKML